MRRGEMIMSQILEQADGLLQALPKEQTGIFQTPFYRLDRLSKNWVLICLSRKMILQAWTCLGK